MSTFEKVISKIFSVIVLIISVVVMLITGGIVSVNFGSGLMGLIVGVGFLSKIFFILGLIFMLLSLRQLIFGEKIYDDTKEGLILENESGKLIISKESLENLISGVGKEIEGAESVTSKTFIDDEKNVIVDVNIVVTKDVSLKEISTELQKKVKAALKQTADLDVKHVNIKVKNISSKKSKKPVVEEAENEKND